jgi:3-oxoacyl-[acyl-carrier protein] reductase
MKKEISNTAIYPDLKDKVVLITGGSRGIGRAIAESFAQQGSRIAITGRNSPALELTVSELHASYNAKIEYYEADVFNNERTKQVVKNITEDFGGLNILINNAGVIADGPSLRMTETQWNEVINTNATGTFFYCQSVGRQMRKANLGGSIVNVSSIAGLRGHPNQANYSVAKAAINILTQTLAGEWAQYGIRVNAVAPGFIPTDLTNNILENKKIGDMIRESIPLKRFGEPSEVANMALYLASDQSSYITGSIIPIDGGLSSQL